MMFNSDLLFHLLASPNMARTKTTRTHESSMHAYYYTLLPTHTKTSNVTKSLPKIKLEKLKLLGKVKLKEEDRWTKELTQAERYTVKYQVALK